MNQFFRRYHEVRKARRFPWTAILVVTPMLETERDYFEKHREDLLRQYPGKFVVIKDQQLVGSFETIQDALGAGAREFGTTSFLVRRTDESPEDVSIPALTLGLLSADSSQSTDGSR
jgi:hypothetical protein